MKQAQNLMRQRKQTKRRKKTKEGLATDKPYDKKKYKKAKEEIKPETFFYKCEVPQR